MIATMQRLSHCLSHARYHLILRLTNGIQPVVTVHQSRTYNTTESLNCCFLIYNIWSICILCLSFVSKIHFKKCIFLYLYIWRKNIEKYRSCLDTFKGFQVVQSINNKEQESNYNEWSPYLSLHERIWSQSFKTDRCNLLFFYHIPYLGICNIPYHTGLIWSSCVVCIDPRLFIKWDCTVCAGYQSNQLIDIRVFSGLFAPDYWAYDNKKSTSKDGYTILCIKTLAQ